MFQMRRCNTAKVLNVRLFRDLSRSILVSQRLNGMQYDLLLCLLLTVPRKRNVSRFLWFLRWLRVRFFDEVLEILRYV